MFATRRGRRGGARRAVRDGVGLGAQRSRRRRGVGGVRVARPLRVTDPELVPTPGRKDLGWLGRVPPHVVLTRVASGPGMRGFDPSGWVRADRCLDRLLPARVARVLRASVALVAEGSAWDAPGADRRLVRVRANQKSAPYPSNDPDAAPEHMRRFYALVAADGGLSIDPRKAAARKDRLVAHPPYSPARESRFTKDDLTTGRVTSTATCPRCPSGPSMRPPGCGSRRCGSRTSGSTTGAIWPAPCSPSNGAR